MSMHKKLAKLRSSVSNQLQHLRQNAYLFKTTLLHQKALSDGTIQPFDENFYQQMNHTYVDGIPVSMHIKYLKPSLDQLGKCLERSKYMFYCFDDALLARGDLKYLELENGSKECAIHGWIEIGDHVYDPAMLEKFPKDLYYKMYGVSNVTKYTKEEYLKNEDNKKLYDEIKNTKLEDFRAGGMKHYYFQKAIPMVAGYAKYSHNEDLMEELYHYLNSVKSYDEQQVDYLLQINGSSMHEPLTDALEK